jgi:hypothetical protein
MSRRARTQQIGTIPVQMVSRTDYYETKKEGKRFDLTVRHGKDNDRVFELQADTKIDALSWGEQCNGLLFCARFVDE